MRRCPYILVSVFLVIFTLPVLFLCASEKANTVRLATLQDPIRIGDLSALPTSLISSKKIPYPLLYPGELSIFSLIDFADPSFKSLEILKKLPVRNNFAELNNDKLINPAKVLKKSKQPQSQTLAHELDPIIEFVKSDPSKSLPTDDELRIFLNHREKTNSRESNSRQPNPDIASSSKTFAEFRSEAESSLISKIFNRSTKVKAQEASSVHKEMTQVSANTPAETTSHSENKGLHHIISSTVKLKAKKPNTAGQLEPAQASEFYLTTQNLNELLQNLEAGPAVEGELKSVAEIWAKAEKNASQAPEVALGVKSILLQAKVSKARTDPYGEAALRGVQPDEKYFLIGIDKDVQSNVVTIWSKEVAVQPGENLVELSSSDVIYQE